MSKSNPNFGVFNHEAGQTQHGRGLNPDHGPDLPARQFQSLRAFWPKRVTVLR